VSCPDPPSVLLICQCQSEALLCAAEEARQAPWGTLTEKLHTMAPHCSPANPTLLMAGSTLGSSQGLSVQTRGSGRWPRRGAVKAEVRGEHYSVSVSTSGQANRAQMLPWSAPLSPEKDVQVSHCSKVESHLSLVQPLHWSLFRAPNRDLSSDQDASFLHAQPADGCWAGASTQG
jgi:hypothetical protein